VIAGSEKPGLWPGILLLCVTIAVVASWLVAWLLWEPVLISNDGLQYLSTAANWLDGEGFSTSALIYDPHFQGRLPAYQTVWPVALPFFIALVSTVGLDLQSAALLFNLISHTLSAVLVYFILRRCQTGFTFRTVCACLFYVTTMGWYYAASILTEPFFTCLVLGAALCLPGREDKQFTRLAFSGLLIALCIWVRLSGVFTALSFGLALFCLFLYQTRQASSRASRLSLGGIALFTFFPVAGFAAWLLRTHLLIGDVNRNTGVGEAHSLLSVVSKFAEEGSVLLGFRDGILFANDVDKWLFFLFVILASGIVLAVLILALSKKQKRPDSGKFTTTISFVFVVHALVFCGYLAYCRITTVPLDIMTRYLYQVYPGLFVLFCLLVANARQEMFRRNIRIGQYFLHTLTGALAVLYVIAQINMVSAFRDFSSRGIDAEQIVNLPVSDALTIANIVASCVGEADSRTVGSLWSNEGSLLHLTTGVPTITLTSIYTTSAYDFTKFRNTIDAYDIRLFVFVNNTMIEGSAYARMLDSIKEWLHDQSYAKLTLEKPQLESGSSIEVFATDGACFEVSG